MPLDPNTLPEFTAGQELPGHKVVAKNYAEASENKMHSGDVARRYGYSGGLVPGVGVFAYMTVPVAQALGKQWLGHGTMAGKFLKPLYDGEVATVRSHVSSIDPIRITVSIVNDADVLCAVGEASLPDKHAHLEVSRFPFATLPKPGQKLPPKVDALEEDIVLGSLEFTVDPGHQEGEYGNFLDEMQDSLPVYRGPEAAIHPAFLLQKANGLLVQNIELGPWIHTASDVNYYATPKKDETLFMRGKIAHSYTKRGHDIVVLDIAVLGEEERPIAHLTHTAIVRPHETGG